MPDDQTPNAQPTRAHIAWAVQLYRCTACDMLHLVVTKPNEPQTVVIMSAENFAEMFMADPDFRKAASAKLAN